MNNQEPGGFADHDDESSSFWDQFFLVETGGFFYRTQIGEVERQWQSFEKDDLFPNDLTFYSLLLRETHWGFLERKYHELCCSGEERLIHKVSLDCCIFENLNSMNLFFQWTKLMGKSFNHFSMTCEKLIWLQPVLVEIQKQENISRLLCLSLSGADFEEAPREVQALKNLLKDQQCQIRELEVDGCQWDGQALLPLLRGVQEHRLGLTRLSLHECTVFAESEEQPVTQIVDSLVNSPTSQTLECLDLSFFMNDGGTRKTDALPSLARLLLQSNNLRDFRLSGNQSIFATEPNSPEYESLMSALKKNTSLKYLNLSGCLASKALYSPLFQALQVNTTLEEINVLYAHQTVPDAALIQNLPGMRGLRTLNASIDLSSNAAVRAAFVQNISLTRLCYTSPDRDLHRIFYRNRMISRARRMYLDEHASEWEHNVNAWILCVDSLRVARIEMTPTFVFLRGSTEQLATWTRPPN